MGTSSTKWRSLPSSLRLALAVQPDARRKGWAAEYPGTGKGLKRDQLRPNGIKGIEVPSKSTSPQHEIASVSCFADDLCLFLKDTNQLPRFKQLLEIYEEGAGALNSWEKTEGMRIGSSVGETTLPTGWKEGEDIVTSSGVIRYLGIFLGTNDEVAKKWLQRTTKRIKDKANIWRERRMPKTRAGRGTALKNSILAQAWFLVENQTPAGIEQMMESWRKEAWSFYGNHTSRTNCSTNISHTTLIQDYPEGGQRAPDVENFCKAIHTTKLRRMLEPHTGQHTNYVKYWMNKDYGKLRQGLRLLASNCDFLDLSNNVPLYWRVILKNIGCMRGFSDAKDHGARAKRAREGGTNTLGGEIRQWNGILSIGEILMEPIFYNPRIGGPWNDRIQEKVGWELEDRKKRNECHIIRSSKYRRDLATERLKKNIEIAEVGITHMTHLIKGAGANETLDIHSWESLNEKYNSSTNNLPPQIHNSPEKIVAFGAYERHRWGGKNVVFILELARSEEALREKMGDRQEIPQTDNSS